MLANLWHQNSTTELSCTISTLFWERERKRHRTMGSNEWSNNVSSKSTPTMSDMWGKKFSTNWLEWHCSDVDKRLLCYCPLHCWRVEPPLLFLFLQRNFKILGKLYSKFGCLWWTTCPLGMGYDFFPQICWNDTIMMLTNESFELLKSWTLFSFSFTMQLQDSR